MTFRSLLLAGLVAATARAQTPPPAPLSVGLLVFDGVQLSDAAVASDILGRAGANISIIAQYKIPIQAVFGATISYVMMTLSHIILRIKEPNLERPYRTPGGIVTTGIAFVLAIVALIAGFLVDTRVLVITAIVYVIALLYFGLYSRHHIVATAPEEEFELIESAESELH